jgi:pimeloyl-ACP methyl ester carboxylesterase
MRTVIVVAEDDRITDFERHSTRLHAEIKQSRLHRIAGVGHMMHQSVTTEVMAAIDQAAAARVR